VAQHKHNFTFTSRRRQVSRSLSGVIYGVRVRPIGQQRGADFGASVAGGCGM
jgi:hypothetical protein